MINGTWFIDGRYIGIKVAGGGAIAPSAKEIFSAVFKAENKVRGVEMNETPQQVLRDLSFSKYPLELKVKLTSANSLIATLFGESNGTIVDIPSLPSDDVPDHIVHDGTWYPIDCSGLLDALGTIDSVDLRLPGPITLLQYIRLRKLSISTGFIVDEIMDTLKAYPENDVLVSPSFAGQLYPYQLEGFQWLAMIAREGIGCVLADEMGLGKTIQIIALLVSVGPSLGSSLVIAPSSLLENWRREVVKFAPELSILVHQGGERTGFPSDIARYDVVVTSYETAVRDSSLFSMIHWGIIVADEAQTIKSPDAKRTQAIKSLDRSVAIAVTGTPIENRMTDLWSIVDFVVPGLLGSQADFESHYADEVDAAAEVEPIVSPIMLRRRVEDVAGDLPPRIDIPQALVMDRREAEAYERVRQEVGGSRGTGLAALTRLRMFCTHPFLVEQRGQGMELDVTTKYKRFLEIVDEIFKAGEKVIVFSSYKGMADIICNDIVERFGVACGFIDGRIPIRERQAMIDQFSSGTNPAMLVLNPRAAGVGLNITAANHVIHYNLEWNPALEDQASARAFRRGQTRPVTVHRLFYVDTVEEVIDDRMKRKRELAMTAVVGTDGTGRDHLDLLEAINRSPLTREW